MKLPGTNAGLTEVFKKALPPDVSEFNGEYLVDMLTTFPSLKRFSHRKVFYRNNDRVMGNNVLFNGKFGYFLVQEGVCEELGSLEAAVLNYDRRENAFFIRRVRDHVRCLEKDALYVGRFNYLFSGRLYFMGYFSLEKIR